MISKAMADLLNEQINNELHSAHNYQQMAAWASHNGYPGAASFLIEQAYEEREHMQKIFDYMLLMDQMAYLGDIKNVDTDFKGLNEIFVAAYEQEQKITKQVNRIAHEALTTQDYSTFEFIQWFIAEQREEEDLFRDILDRFEILKGEKNAHYYIDRELAAIRSRAAAEADL